MNLTELIEAVSKEHNLSKAFAGRILKTILRIICQELKQSRLVRLRNFGTFTARKSHRILRAKFDDSKNFFKKIF